MENITFQGLRIPLKKSGTIKGKTTASSSNFLASFKSAMSSLQKKFGRFANFTCFSSNDGIFTLFTKFHTYKNIIYREGKILTSAR